jgi:membrane-bound serine protease (ClpP class)
VFGAGIGLMVAEVHIGSLGLIGVAGVVAFVIGAIMFPSRAPGMTLSPPLLAVAAVASVVFLLLVLGVLLRSRRRAVVTGAEALIGAEGEALSWQGTEGRVRVMSEIWRARAAAELQPGTRVKVIAREGLVVVVEPA